MNGVRYFAAAICLGMIGLYLGCSHRVKYLPPPPPTATWSGLYKGLWNLQGLGEGVSFPTLVQVDQCDPVSGAVSGWIALYDSPQVPFSVAMTSGNKLQFTFKTQDEKSFDVMLNLSRPGTITGTVNFKDIGEPTSEILGTLNLDKTE